ncbi:MULTISPECIES: DUF2905 domain-containing protein [Pandoraea]|uniref:Protein of uncharacterized function (DUF2905) n=2 Tax=Pandoraea TaxID=93217 RepID=A0A378YS06_9BURK|nr:MULTISPECIES: DUF2905 domain-containing protein [Pandoraea]AHB07719.2 hypothetical protein U875_22125 [Pandoraea pnomenusa 3kgm]AHB76084.1 hypothetical protein X636_12035 [Pandoraea pnomenusa]AHN75587.1 hypothetical protein DA70_14805 [Pandoraea pnomenusa]AIU27830.1 hypothetical protein LV28_15880 [Pandoraea pnomenusa]ANC44959.1 hypothetical protein A6P55_12970 [Pandoraea pnomenusa]
MFRWMLTIFFAICILSAASPWLAKLGIGRLPGDLRLRWRGREMVFPFASTVVLSLVFNLLIRLL